MPAQPSVDAVPAPPELPAAPPVAAGGDALADTATRIIVGGRHPSSMVTDRGQVVAWGLAKLLSGVVFPQRVIDQLRLLEQGGPVVYVLRHRSLLDYLYFNIAFQQHGLQLVRFAAGVNTWSVRPAGPAVSTLLRGRRGLPDEVACFEKAVRAGVPSLLFLDPSTPAGRADKVAAPFLDRLLALEREAPTGLRIAPLLLIWDKHPDHHRPTLIDDIFGSRQNPGFFRKLTHVAKQTWESFLHLGAPQVQLAEPIAVADIADDDAAALTTRVRSELERERRIIVGPEVKTAQQIREEILTDPRMLETIREIAAESGRDFGELQQHAAVSLKAIAADFDMQMIKMLSSALTAIFNQIYDGLDIDQDGLERIRDVARTKRVVLVPSHKSHIDYLVLSYVFYNYSLIPPHIAAGENLSFWPMGAIFRRAGAFFLRRSFAGDPLYTKVFNAYLVKLLEEGFFIEFFIEGTRSRTGKLNPPKYGMLNMLVDAFATGTVGDVAFVPVSVGYENVIEGATYQKELEGGEKQAESLGGLLKTSKVLQSKYGRVYVEFGDPIDAATFLQTYHPDGTGGLTRDEMERTVRRLAYAIIHRINAVTTVTPSAVAALVILNYPARGMDRAALVREVGFVVAFLRERGVRLSGSLEMAIASRFASIRGHLTTPLDVQVLDEYDRDYVDDSAHMPSANSTVRLTDEALGEAVYAALDEAFRLLASKGLIDVRSLDDATVFVAPEERRTELAFYKNNIIHYFVAEAVFATALWAGKGGELDGETLRGSVRLLSRLLKHEFCFDERARFDEVLSRVRAYFAARGWIEERDGDRVAVSDPPPAGVEFLRGLLIPTLEAYHLCALVAAESATDWVDERALMKRAITRGKAMHLKGELQFGEAYSKATLENAVRVYREWEVLESRDATAGRRRSREVRLTDHYKAGAMRDLLGDLGPMIEQQRRTPGEALRRS